jgi:hypothetical protein
MTIKHNLPPLLLNGSRISRDEAAIRSPLKLISRCSRLFAALAGLAMFGASGLAQDSPVKPEMTRSVVWGTWQSWGDQRDGSYRNPVLL